MSLPTELSAGDIRHLLVLEVWRDAAIRKRLRSAIRRGAPRVVRRLLRRTRA